MAAGYLFIREGPNSGEVHRLGDDSVLVGRESTCAIRIRDPYVSRRHLRLEAGEEGVRLIELGGRNTTEINGMPFQGEEYTLRKGDEITVGGTMMVYVPADPTGLPDESDVLDLTRTETFDSDATAMDLLEDTPGLSRVRQHVKVVGPLDVTVLIQGESGVGKELVAAALHAVSQRAGGPMVTVNCAAIPRDLVESELFGHEKGAFTGADRRRQGKFELAIGGTLFLDEVGELPLEGQSKLLRVLEERKISRVGGQEEIAVDVRIVAATNRDLHEMAKDGSFRVDLLYRLEVVKIEVPPLRDRVEDIISLANTFLRTVSTRIGRATPHLTPEAEALLTKHRWPGNVRELKNALERAAIFATGGEVTPEVLQLTHDESSETGRVIAPDLTATIRRPRMGDASTPSAPVVIHESGVASIDEILRKQIESALRKTKGNKKRAAEMLGISRSSLYNYLNRFGLK